MKRRYLIPFSVVLGGHLLLLFGFKSPGRAHLLPPPAKPTIEPIDHIPVDLVDDSEPAADSAGDPESRADDADPVPGQPEPATLPNPLAPVMPMPPSRPVFDGKAVLDRIPRTWSAGGDGNDFGGPPIISAHHLDKAPVARLQTPPAYPFSARQSGRSAEVVVEFIVDEWGTVLAPRVVRSSDPEFNDSTLRAVAKWRFEPGRKDGRPVRFRMSVPVVFNLMR